MEPPPHLTKLRYGAHAAISAVFACCTRRPTLPMTARPPFSVGAVSALVVPRRRTPAQGGLAPLGRRGW
jgi:hypothetical protein